MKTQQKILAFLLLLIIAGSLSSFRQSGKANVLDGIYVPDKPADWNITGANYKEYLFLMDRSIKHSGESSASLKYVGSNPKGFGAFAQLCEPGQYLGKRVRLSAFVKTQDVNDWAGLWFRLDKRGTTQVLGFDNMGSSKRPIKKTKDWQQYSIVLDVPAETFRLVYGALLYGKGQVWVDDVHFEIVDPSVKTTCLSEKELNIQNKSAVPSKDNDPGIPVPANLDFEK